MTCFRLGENRELFAFPYPISIWKDPPKSIDHVKDLVEAYRFVNIYTVGDVVTNNFLNYGLIPTSAAVDEKTRREAYVRPTYFFRKVLRVRNPPGYITAEAWTAVEEAVRDGGVIIKVEGEEDMLSLAFIKLAPSHSIVIYGHYLGALVAIPVDWYRESVLKLFDYLERC
ncbi:MAG: GTP-dependent dephospho-CoA kinase family protein [Pyrobaculum sp.]